MATILNKLFNHQQYPLLMVGDMLVLGANQLRPHLSLLLAVLALLAVMPSWSITVMLWLAMAIFTTAFGLIFRWYYQQPRQDWTLTQLKKAEYIGLCYSLLAGLLWGNSSVLLVAGDTEHNLMISMIYLGVCAGASTIAIFGLAHLLVGSIVALVLFVSRFYVIFPENTLWMIMLFSLYHVVILRMAVDRNSVIISNILLRQEKEELLAQQRLEVAKVKQANQDKSAFLAAASHDLRQPVHALMLLGHALRLRVPSGEEGRLVEHILEAGQALSEQFNNLMDLSRLEGGAYRLNYSHIALDDFIQRLINTHGQVAAAKGIRLTFAVKRSLGQQSLYSDVGLLGRIMDNLIVNAIKFSPANSKMLVTIRHYSGHLYLSVYDQGIGIAPEQQQQIFKPYIQLNNPNRDREKGIGLGLSIVNEAANLLGASLKLFSVVDRGSHFQLCLSQPNLTVSRTINQARPSLPQRQYANVTNLQGRRLLLVEDDPMAASALITWAQSWGLVVTHHTHPQTVTQNEAPDLILCDIRLPSDRDGIDHLTDWLVDWPDARGLLLSGELLAETHQRAEQEGLLLLSKPVDPDMLLQTLSGLLR